MASISISQALQTALSFERAGMPEPAEALYRQILSADANQPEVWRRLGLIASATGRPAEALQFLSQAIVLAPDTANYHADVGLVYRGMGQLEKAIECYRASLARQENQPGLYMNLCEALSRLRRFDEAIVYYRRTIELSPDHAASYCDLGVALGETGAPDEAIASFRRAIALDPNLSQAHNNLGWALTGLERYDEAIAVLSAARDRFPDAAAIYKNLGNALFRGGYFREAERCYRAWVARHPGDGTAHRSLGHVLLCFGQFAEGWREFEWRHADADFRSEHRSFSVPRWDGRPMAGGTLLLHAEQGFGDALNFLRYLPVAVERSGARRVLVECPRALERLLRQSFGAPVEFTIYRQGLEPGPQPFDCYASAFSLPFLLGMYEPLPMPEPYLRLDPAWRGIWRERLGPATGRRVGINWAGNSTHVNDWRRSIAARRLLPLLTSHPEIRFYSLQIEPPNDEGQSLREAGLIDLTEHITDFADTAAFLSELDLIISVDTAVVHLAGALGRPVWTMLPLAPDWRWGLHREDTRWYPTMRLFRQKRAGDWHEVIERVNAAL